MPAHPYKRPAPAHAAPAAPAAKALPTHPYARPARRDEPRRNVITPAVRERVAAASAVQKPPTQPTQSTQPAARPKAQAPAAQPTQGARMPQGAASATGNKIIAKLRARAERAQQLEQRLGSVVTRELSGLSESARKLVADLAGKDPTRQLDVLETLRQRGVLGKASVAGSKPASTEPKAAAPKAASAPAAPNAAALRQQYEALKSKSPNLAAAFFARHREQLAAKG
jgi:hypothetical protein